jgi:hypothetical protein
MKYPILIAPTHVPELNEITVTDKGAGVAAGTSLCPFDGAASFCASNTSSVPCTSYWECEPVSLQLAQIMLLAAMLSS